MDKSGHKRDRSPAAEARRVSRNIVMNFTGWAGLMRAQISHRIGMVFKKRPARGWAAARRHAKFEDFLPPDKMEEARCRHKWRQKQLAA